MSMDKRWSELFARLDAVEKQLAVLTAVLEPEKKDSKAPEKKAPVKK